jgi:hypothetical protein
MFRKAWAQFALAVDSRLLPVIQMHFHHLSLSMTEGGYIGNNPIQVESIRAVSRQQRTLLIYEAVIGRSLLAGQMGEQIEQNLDELRERVEGMSTSNAWKEVAQYCDDLDLQIWWAPHGKCLPLSPTAMRCHESAGTVSWLNREPNYATREPSLCAGCRCFILDLRHRGYWEDRYVQNSISFELAIKRGVEHQFRVVKQRANQAGKLLRKIGVDTTPLDDIIIARVNLFLLGGEVA